MFVAALNYGNATILAEPFNAERTPNVNICDLRSEKGSTVKRAGVVGCLDVYNILNTNAEQALATSSWSSWLRPSAITPPRVVRIALKLQW